MGLRTKKRNSLFWDSARKNRESDIFYFKRLLELSISMFEWKNLPKGIDPVFLERVLFAEGQAVFFYDDGLKDYLALQVATNGPFNVYRIPVGRRAYAVNGYQNNLNIDNSVIIYNNMIRTNSADTVRLYSERLWDLDRIVEINAKAQKTPVLIKCGETQRLTMENVYKEWDGNQPVIAADKGFDQGSLSVLKTDAPYVADKIYELKTKYWNEALTYLGISNVNTTKKERMVTDEVIRNMGGTIASRYSRLEARRQACEQINEMFGLDIWVEYRADYREADDELMLTGETEDGNARLIVADVNTNTNVRPKERGET